MPVRSRSRFPRAAAVGANRAATDPRPRRRPLRVGPLGMAESPGNAAAYRSAGHVHSGLQRSRRPRAGLRARVRMDRNSSPVLASAPGQKRFSNGKGVPPVMAREDPSSAHEMVSIPERAVAQVGADPNEGGGGTRPRRNALRLEEAAVRLAGGKAGIRGGICKEAARLPDRPGSCRWPRASAEGSARKRRGGGAFRRTPAAAAAPCGRGRP